jgi:hypothetical protein
MKRRGVAIAVAVIGAALMFGCGGDVAKMMTTNPEMRDKIMGAITANPDLAGQMVDKLMGGDTTRTLVLDRVMANGGAMQEMMARMAKDQTMVDGILNVAVQDSSMHNHVMTLLKGMQMMGKR